MAHPNCLAGLYAFEQRVGVDAGEEGAAIFTRGSALDASAVLIGHHLGSVAYAEHGVLGHDGGYIHFESLFVIDRERTARKNHADNVGVIGGEFVIGHNFAIGVQFADTAADELRGLRTEVKNNNLLRHKRFGK